MSDDRRPAVRRYTNTPGITDDYVKVRSFLIERGYCPFTYARFDWMTTHPNLAPEFLPRIGLWEHDGRIIAAAIFDCHPGDTFLIALPGYAFLYPEMLEYAERELCIDDRYALVISDTDRVLQSAAANAGYIALPEREHDAAFFPEGASLNYDLPAGFTLTDMDETFDLYQYGRVLWKGFNHEKNGEGPYCPDKDDEACGRNSMLRPNVDLKLKIAAVAPNGNFAAYCGMWYDPLAGYAVIEPVACDPDYRKLGLGRAVVLEGVRRVYARGAKLILVGSAQQFYYSIGLVPYASSSKWKKRIPPCCHP